MTTTTKGFGDLIVEIQTGPSTWVAPCGFSSKAMNLTKGTSDAVIPPCPDDGSEPWTYRGGGAKSGEITGSGVYATEDSEFWEDWYDDADTRTIRVRTVGVGYRTGEARLTALGHSVAFGSAGDLVQRAITIVSAGPWPWTSGDPA